MFERLLSSGFDGAQRVVVKTSGELARSLISTTQAYDIGVDVILDLGVISRSRIPSPLLQVSSDG